MQTLTDSSYRLDRLADLTLSMPHYQGWVLIQKVGTGCNTETADLGCMGALVHASRSIVI
jgi:hypothetical protein